MIFIFQEIYLIQMPLGFISNTKSLIKMFLMVFKEMKKPLTHKKLKSFQIGESCNTSDKLVLFEKEQSLYLFS